VQGATLRVQTSIPPGPDLGALKPSPIRSHRLTQPRRAAGRSVVLEQDQRGLLFVTRCASHRELVAHCQFNPTGSKDPRPASEQLPDRVPKRPLLRHPKQAHDLPKPSPK
jgi:hypothetical protein